MCFLQPNFDWVPDSNTGMGLTSWKLSHILLPASLNSMMFVLRKGYENGYSPNMTHSRNEGKVWIFENPNTKAGDVREMCQPGICVPALLAKNGIVIITG